MKTSDNWNSSLVFASYPRENLLCINSDWIQQAMFKHSISLISLPRMHPIRLVWGERHGRISEWWNRSKRISPSHARYCCIHIWFKRIWHWLPMIQSSLNMRDTECALSVVFIYTDEACYCHSHISGVTQWQHGLQGRRWYTHSASQLFKAIGSC